MKLRYYKYKANQTLILINTLKVIIPLILRFHTIFKSLLFDYFFKTIKSYFKFKGLKVSYKKSLQTSLHQKRYRVRLLLIDKNKDGYKIFDKDSKLTFKLGKSHDVVFNITNNFKYKLGRKAKSITFWSFDYKFLFNLVKHLREERYPESYKGKGVLFKHELIIKKKIRKLRSVKNFKKKRRK